jgi:hypothetical protein
MSSRNTRCASDYEIFMTRDAVAGRRISYLTDGTIKAEKKFLRTSIRGVIFIQSFAAPVEINHIRQIAQLR